MSIPYKYHIITFGCQMNKNDSERVESLFRGMGMESTEKETDADVILLNSCSVRESAEARIFGFTKNYVELKKQNPNLVVCVTGCMPGRDKGKSMGDKLQGVDLYFPTKDMVHLPKWLYEINPNFRNMEDLQEDYLSLRPTLKKHTQAFVTLQTGCNHFCSYCVVPFARGLEVNRSLKEILEECNALAENGCIEITLLGQIVNHYIAPDPQYFSLHNPYRKSDFAKLLWEVNQIHGIERIHFTAPHPIFMSEEVIDAMALPKHLQFLHLPVQSGNDEMLRKMNRRHDRQFYLNLVKRIGEKHKNMALGTDIIVGFCGETDAMFEDTVDLYKECQFDISYTAQYSERSGTLAVKAFKDDVDKSEKKRRWWVLQKLMEDIVYQKNQKYIGQTVSVMLENATKTATGEWLTGNSEHMKRVRIQGDDSKVGTIQKVKIEKADKWMLWGHIL
ncbi:MAG: tRNA (N6-isopentenyl adenosine(37)-C2)-methylthiotransferase MiaB [Candidatus Magasanikbacteria bacterium CG11_big_fil_rev_8_21_14_0_20_39_34]|uniref:tRNA-2-methylthio-N(6)-dimethylallyladenosine synthase n=1 Tax=Candidatus Magasanikbacteria bacterium CG11_big_fil_rev_8_21_14_0_20_39_34 TaxID=1974653 RepID=A0A2H0N6C1_9BACT|nr:MAG: tRNA (N6-isopentenyl adenosine(37)-C2)-methylthiotransferase MiaB [Candidatus Magasanikbacteria bacterium CG11_big_fil_rev_8_21_14_0_20_39_34]